MASNPNGTRIQYEELRSIAFGALSGDFVAVGNVFANPVRIAKLVNGTDVDLLVSYDGETNHDIIPTGGFTLYDYCSNLAMPAGRAEQAMGTQLWVREAGPAATSGSFYAVIIYVAGANV